MKIPEKRLASDQGIPSGKGDPSCFARRALDNERGLTIAELLMAAFIGLVILGASWGTVAVQGRSAAYQVGLADAQEVGRGAGVLLLRDLRLAGYGMLGVPADADLAPLEYNEAGGGMTLRLRAAFDDVSAPLQVSSPAGASSITVSPPAGGGTFTVGENVLIDSGLDAEVREISGTSSLDGNIVLQLDSSLDAQYPVGPSVTQIEEVVYEWDGQILTRNGEIVAESAPELDFEFIDHEGVVRDSPETNLRSVVLTLQATDPSPLPDSPVAQSVVQTEVNVRNMAFRFDLS